MYCRKDKKFASIVAINGNGHFVVTNSVRELFSDFHECRGARKWGGGGWLTSAALHCVRPLAFQRNQKFWPLKSGFEFDSTVESQRLYTGRFYSHLNDQLMLGSFNLRCNTRNVGPFREEGCIV